MKSNTLTPGEKQAENDLPLTRITIPTVGRVPAYVLDTENQTQVRNLIARCEAYFGLSRKAWLKVNHEGGKMTPVEIDTHTARERDNAKHGEDLLTPLGIRVDWPGLYASFTVNGYTEHTTEAAVVAALGHPRNWLA